jgi:hypothetical protein
VCRLLPFINITETPNASAIFCFCPASYRPHVCHSSGGIQVATGKNIAFKHCNKERSRPSQIQKANVTKPKKRRISAKGRAAISAAMKARWAKAKKEAKKVTKTASPAKVVKKASVG